MQKMARLGVLVLVALLAAATAQAQGSLEPKLRYGFYKRLCPYAEDIVREAVRNATNVNPGLGAGLIRMAFHDCFVQVRELIPICFQNLAVQACTALP